MLAFLRRLRGSLRTSAFEDAMAAELAHHLALETEALVRRGMRPDEARDLARQRFGSVAQIEDACRESWGMRAVDTLRQDARHTLRDLRAYPGYTALVLLTLALGIGGNSAIFSVVNAVLLRPLPYANGTRLVELRQQAPTLGVANAGLSVTEIADYRARTPAFDAVVEYHQMWFNLLGRGEASRVQTGVVSADFFDVMGVAPILGRTFRPEDDGPNAAPVLILSYEYWKTTLGGDPAVVNRTFEMNDRVHTVVGVLPPMPQFPDENDVYMPPSACPFRSNPRTVERRDARMLGAIARLRPGGTLEEAQRDVTTVAERLVRTYPELYDQSRTGFRTAALSVHDELTRQARPTLLILLAATGFVLLLVAANVANLALARVKFASPAYFQTIGMSLLSGRVFTVADAAQAPPVAVVNLSMARHYFPGRDPIGRRVSLDGGRSWMTVVGLVNDVRQYGLATVPSDELYQPFARPGPLSATLLVRTAGDPEAFARRLSAVVHAVDARQPVSRVQTLEAIRRHSLAPPKLTAMLVALFAGIALVVTAAGIAGVVSFTVSQRAAEIGVRMALGAPRRSVVALVVRQGLRPVVAGLAIGLLAAPALTRAVARLLFDVEPTDPATYTAVVAGLLAAAALACLAPARRAVAIDPIRTLRAD